MKKLGNKKSLPIWGVLLLDLLATIMVIFAFVQFYVKPYEAQVQTAAVANVAMTAQIDEQSETKAVPTAPPAPNPTPTIAPTPTPPPTWAEKFSEHFTDTVVTTDMSYSSPNISINIEKVVTGEGREQLTYFVADIHITDIKYFQTYLADNKYGNNIREYVEVMDKESGALLAMTGDFYDHGEHEKGAVIRNGVLYNSDHPKLDVCVLHYDGTMACFSPDEFDLDTAIAKGAYQVWAFGPMLLDKDGNLPEEYNAKGRLRKLNPRAGLGYIEPGHYVYVVVDGRQRGYSRGVSLEEYSQIFKDLGCVAAYNMDGGESAVMSFNDLMVNRAYKDGRHISDILIIKEVED